MTGEKVTWNETFTTVLMGVTLLSTFSKCEKQIVLCGTGLADAYRLSVDGKDHGVIVGTDQEKLTQAVRDRLGKDVEL